jgi:hypothetical protein
MDEHEQLVLFAREHVGSLRIVMPGRRRNKSKTLVDVL